MTYLYILILKALKAYFEHAPPVAHHPYATTFARVLIIDQLPFNNG